MADGAQSTWRRLDLPWIQTRIDDYRVTSWEVAVGERVRLGDPICTVKAGALAGKSSRVGAYRDLHWLRRRQVDRMRKGRTTISFRARIIAGEPGIVRSILAPVGTAVSRDDPLALLCDEPDSAEVPPTASLKSFRAEADVIGRETEA